jgi:hypothetical protein
MSLAVEGAFRVRVDNKPQAPLLNVIFKRPAEMLSFSNFDEDAMGDDASDGGDDPDDMISRLPTRPYDPIDIIILGGEEGSKKLVRGRVASLPKYEGGERLLVLVGGHSPATPDSRPFRLRDATVAGPAVNLGGGSLYKLQVAPEGGKGGKPREATFDLNDFNHCVQRFENVDSYLAERNAYLAEMTDKLSTIEDAITGNKLSLDDQEAVYITLDSTGQRRSFTSNTEVTNSWSKLDTMEDLARHIITPSYDRIHGTHDVQGVLLRAGPGTGKTVSLQQLTRLIALRLKQAEEQAKGGDEEFCGGIGLVPLLVSVQRLATYMNKPGSFMQEETKAVRARYPSPYLPD